MKVPGLDGLDSLGEVWTSLQSLLLFCAFFIPGFISSQLYGCFVGVDDTDFSKRLPAVIGYSALHFGLTGWIVLVVPGQCKVLAGYIVLLLLPIVWPPVILMIRNPKRWKKVFIFWQPLQICNVRLGALPLPNVRQAIAAMQTPEAMPWDGVLGEPAFIRIRLKSGRYVGGFLANGSLCSTYPSERQIFIAQAYTFDDDGTFGKPIEGTGVMVQGDEIEVLETVVGGVDA